MATDTTLSSLLASLTDTLQNRANMMGERSTEIATNRGIRDQYSKDAAFKDAQGLMQGQLQGSMDASLLALTRAVEGAGASGSSLRALLTQRAADDAAQSAAALGAEQAVQYGNISNSASQVLELLTRPDDEMLQALINAQQIRQNANAAKTTTKQSGGSSSGGARNTVSNSTATQRASQSVRPVTQQKQQTVTATYDPWPTTSLPNGGLSPKRAGVQTVGNPDNLSNQYTNILNATPVMQQDLVRQQLLDTMFAPRTLI